MIRQILESADTLFEIARARDMLEEIYFVISKYAKTQTLEGMELSERAEEYIGLIPDLNHRKIMESLLSRIRKELKILTVDVISAVTLTGDQLRNLEERLVRLVHKRVGINNIVDSSIIGGLKITIGNTVIDNSIKSQLNNMKKELYKGVYFKID